MQELLANMGTGLALIGAFVTIAGLRTGTPYATNDLSWTAFFLTIAICIQLSNIASAIWESK